MGAGGPILLHDSYLIEQMAQWNRERIPERQPHAKGSGAFGRLEITKDVSAYTKAALFQPNTTTPLGARFSTVAGERGSPDLWRDLRGFALKFYTSEGNYDMVGNDTPVFFIKDPIHFQNFIRSQKRRIDNNLRSNDMQWDFWTLLPETAHQVVWLMGDRGLPKSWRNMNGYIQPHLHVDQRAWPAVLGEVPLQDRPGHRVLHRRPSRRPGLGRLRLPHPGPVRGDRPRRSPQLDDVRADHAVR